MAQSNHLTDMSLRYQVLLERLKSSKTKPLEEAAKAAGEAATQVISDLRSENLSDLTRQQLENILKEAEAVQNDAFSQAVEDFLSTTGQEIAQEGTSFEADALNEVFQTSTSASVSVADASEAYQRALSTPLSSSGELLEPFVKDWSRREVGAVNNTIRRAHSEGWTNQEIVQAIRGTKAQNYRDGIVATTSRHATTVGQTAIQHVSSVARDETWAQNEDIVKGYIWVSTLDSRTTQQCRSLDGEKFKRGKGPKPPIHPRCRSTTVADLDDRFDFLDRDATRSSEQGPVDADQTYYGWLKKQPSSFQDAAIGPKRAKLLREGGLSAEEFAKLNLGKNFEPLTLREMQELKPSVFEKAGVQVASG